MPSCPRIAGTIAPWVRIRAVVSELLKNTNLLGPFQENRILVASLRMCVGF